MELTPEPPRDHYLWLGRVIAAASMLEIQIGMIGWAHQHQRPWTEDWSEVAGGPGAAMTLCKKQRKHMHPDLAKEVANLLNDADVLFKERNRYAHAVFTLDPTRPSDDQWLLKSARDSDFHPLTESDGADLVRRCNQLSRIAKSLSTRAAETPVQ